MLESFYRSDERSSGGGNTQVRGHCGEKPGVRRDIATIAACYPIPAENLTRCGWANLDHTMGGTAEGLGTPRIYIYTYIHIYIYTY